MLTRPVIRAQSISKSYRLKAQKNSGGFLAGLFGRTATADVEHGQDDNVFWALQDVSLEIVGGSMVGVLGLNGAGKSTFLKIVSGALHPTSGSIERTGEVALIELGAGFNYHQSARENIRAFGRQKGLFGDEIEEKIAYVEEFADIGIFFDQPLNTYSSGMQSRVGFGNAFSIDPDVLIIDEALAVGDASFTNKCFRRIDDLRLRGTSILFASHDRYTISRLCDFGMVLDHGKLQYFGTAKEASLCYEKIVDQAISSKTQHKKEPLEVPDEVPLEELPIPPAKPAEEREVLPVPEDVLKAFIDEPSGLDILKSRPGFNAASSRFGNGDIEIVDYMVWPKSPINELLKYTKSSPISILAKVIYKKDSPHPVFGLEIESKEGILLYGANTIMKNIDISPIHAGECSIYCISMELRLPNQMECFVSLAVADGPHLPTATIYDKRTALFCISVDGEPDSTGMCDLPLTIHKVFPVSSAKLSE